MFFARRVSLPVALAFALFFPHKAKSAAPLYPGIYGTLGIIPGLGHVAQGEFGEGLGWFGTSLLLMGSGDPHLGQIGFDVWMYNMYDAYRDAGAVKAAKHTAFENYMANFVPTNLLDPIGAPIVGFGALAGASNGYPALRSPLYAFDYTFVGWGEEALFRGFLFPGFSSLLFGSTVLGALSSSALFAAVHDNANAAAFSMRFIGGLLFCWQASRNNYDLRRNIFAHSWYDIFVGGAGKVPVYGIRYSSLFF